MCAAFIDAVDKRTWTPYPETADWDILLVRNTDGFQIGIQAKQRLNAKVISQALEDKWGWKVGPDCRAVLVPNRDSDLERIAAYVGLTVIEVRGPAPKYVTRTPFYPDLPHEHDPHNLWNQFWHEMAPIQRHPLPEYVPDVVAGAPAPVRLTAWKIAAIKVAVLLERRGFITRADFKALGIDHRRWLPHEGGWTAKGDNGLIAGPNLPDFRAQHPVVYEQIAADFDAWAPKVVVAANLVQRELL